MIGCLSVSQKMNTYVIQTAVESCLDLKLTRGTNKNDITERKINLTSEFPVHTATVYLFLLAPNSSYCISRGP